MKYTIVLALIFSLSAAAEPADRYWQIKEVHKEGFTYWKTHTTPNWVEIQEACDPDRMLIKATAVGDKKWNLTQEQGAISGVIERNGDLKLTQLDGTLFGIGKRIAPVSCGQDKKPDKVTYIQVALAEQTLAVEGDMSQGEQHLEASRNASLIENRTGIPAPPALGPLEMAWGLDSRRCTTQPRTESIDKNTQEMPIFGENSEIWVGNLLQGKDFKLGRLTPITIPRAGGTITVSNVNFAPGAKNSARLPLMSKAVAERAISSLTNQKVLGTESNSYFRVEQVFGNDQLAYALGVDGRFSGNLSDKLKIDENSRNNHVVLNFAQTFFNVSLEPPEESYSVFREGDKISDRDSQMGADNPPLYISEVGYGRRIIFLASSDSPAGDLIAALNATGAKPGEVSPQDEARYQQILARAQVSYTVYGGSAISSIGPMSTATTANDIYQKIKQVIADQRNAQVTILNKGLPISYTINYLTSRAPATIRFATSANRTECVIIPREYASFYLLLRGVDDSAEVNLIAPNGNVTRLYSGSNGNMSIPIDNDLPTGVNQTYTLQLREYNIAGPQHLNFMLRRSFRGQVHYLNDDGQMVPSDSTVHTSGSMWNVGWQTDTRISLNRFTGEVRLIQK